MLPVFRIDERLSSQFFRPLAESGELKGHMVVPMLVSDIDNRRTGVPAYALRDRTLGKCRTSRDTICVGVSRRSSER